MKKAFTIVEVLVVIAIIAILAALTIPATFNAKQRAAVIKKQQANPDLIFHIGDTVTINQLGVTGIINSLPTYDPTGNSTVSILIKTTNSITVLNNINVNLLKKVRQAEAWP